MAYIHLAELLPSFLAQLLSAILKHVTTIGDLIPFLARMKRNMKICLRKAAGSEAGLEQKILHCTSNSKNLQFCILLGSEISILGNLDYFLNFDNTRLTQ